MVARLEEDRGGHLPAARHLHAHGAQDLGWVREREETGGGMVEFECFGYGQAFWGVVPDRTARQIIYPQTRSTNQPTNQ